MSQTEEGARSVLGRSSIFTPEVINDIHVKSELGLHVDVVDDLRREDPAVPELIAARGSVLVGGSHHSTIFRSDGSSES